MSRKNCTNIGGQAVLEGVMMRGTASMATAVRDPEGKIQIESKRITPTAAKPLIYRLPIVRGVVALFSSFVTGSRTLMRAAEVYGDVDQTPSRFENWLAKTFKIDVMNVVTTVGLVLGVALALVIFVLIPNLLTDLIYRFADLTRFQPKVQDIFRNLTSGAIRIAIFVGYIWLTSLIKDIKRLYMYHGAEHKVISCFEHGLPLTVENAQKMSTVHDRCGTTFLFLVMIVSIVFFSFFGWYGLWLRMLIRIACIPIVAGISYECLKLFAKYDNIFTRIVKAPGLLLQKLTTREPEDEMIEVAIAAFETVRQMDADPAIPEQSFVVTKAVAYAREKLKAILPDAPDEVELLLMEYTDADTRSALNDGRRIASSRLDEAVSAAEKRKKGMPLQYATGNADFYGRKWEVNPDVLIPRFDTERLTEEAIKTIKKYPDCSVLELCTGSGAVAVTIAKESGVPVVATDLSEGALAVAARNAARYAADVSFCKGDLFEAVGDKRFDVIVANPPYIPSGEIASLDAEVKDYEPRGALDGGADGLDFYRRIAAEYNAHLNAGGTLLLEVGIGQADAVADLFGGCRVERVSDYNQPPVERVLIVTEKEESDV